MDRTLGPIAVKICGIKTLEDALRAVEAGADLLGFNFYPPSPRYISPPDCARLVAGLHSRGAQVLAVGVFVNQPVENILPVLEACGLELAQLSGDEPPEALDDLHGRGFKALRPGPGEAALRQAACYARRGLPPALLVDAHSPGQYGGTGQTGNWEVARRVAAAYPLLLAGGLRPENVARAVRAVRPWGVDVASGVEALPGLKDFQRMQAFVRSVRNISQEVE
jgi:phosphoribosylanthranilate isomerase